MNSELEVSIMKIIANAGDAKSTAYRALSAAKNKDFEKAKKLLNESMEKSTKTHNAQTELLTLDSIESGIDVNVLLVHAQDHFMTSLLAIELIEEIIILRQEIIEGDLL